MAYTLGIDLGTTYSAAAVADGGGARVVGLAHDRYAIPSIVAPPHGSSPALVGGAALTVAATEPDRVAREFKRRFGDSTPLIVGGEPWLPEDIMGLLLSSVVQTVTAEMGGEPDDLVLTYPATWRAHRLDLLRAMVDKVGLSSARFVTEPVAAAINYHDRRASRNDVVPDGALVAVYDLGGGTFDAAVLELQGENYAIRGEPEGLGFLGGIDFDLAVLASVKEKAADALAALDPQDPQTGLALARLREQCTLAKEVLSQEHSAIVPVVLPGSTGTVVVQREEFEEQIDDLVQQTVDALERSLNSAGLSDGSDVDSVLLVGGSSRVPLVSRLLEERLGVPVLVDTHPKQAVALGAARALVPRPRSPTQLKTVESKTMLDTAAAEPTVLPPMTVVVAGVEEAMQSRYLLALNGPLSASTIEIGEVPITIGRFNTDSTIGLNDPRISRRHLSAVKTDEGVVISDLDSTNGTWVDGRELTGDAMIEPGTIVEIGSTLLLLEAPLYALPAPEMVAASWSMPPLLLQSGLSGRRANRKAGRAWLDEHVESFDELKELVDRVRRSRRMFRPNGPRTVGWVEHAAERVFPRPADDEYYGSVTLGHGPGPTLFDFTPPAGLKGPDRAELENRLAGFGVDPWVPVQLPILGMETTIALPARDAKGLLRSMLYEFVHFHPHVELAVFGIDLAMSEWDYLSVGTAVHGDPSLAAHPGLVVSYGPGRVVSLDISGRGEEAGSLGSLRVGDPPPTLGPAQSVILPTEDEGVFQVVRADMPPLNFIPATLPAGRLRVATPTLG